MRTPLVSSGTKCIVHEAAEERATWAPNGENAWTIGVAPDYYRCIKCFFPKTRSEKFVKTATFFPTVILYPKVTMDDLLCQGTIGIIKLLTVPLSNIGPILQAGDKTQNALLNYVCKLFFLHI